MKPESIVQLRGSLGVSQVQLADMLGVDPMTVSRWERDLSVPSEHQVEMMGKFDQGAKKDKAVKATIAALIVVGAAAAVGYLLYLAYQEIGKAVKKVGKG